MTKTPTSPSTFTGPAWRCQRVEHWLHSDVDEVPVTEDSLVVDAWKLLRQRGHAGESADVDAGLAHVASAQRLEQEAGEALRILTMGDCPIGEIAHRLGVTETAVLAWEALYFQVRGQRNAIGWIEREVLQPLKEQGKLELVAKLKLCCAGGPRAAQALLEATERVQLGRGVRLFDQIRALQVKLEAVLECPVLSEEGQLQLLKVAPELLHREQKLRVAKERLAQACEKVLLWKEVSDARRRAQELRQSQRAAAAAQHEESRQQCAEARRHEDEAREYLVALLRASEVQELQEQCARSQLATLTWCPSSAPHTRQVRTQPPRRQSTHSNKELAAVV